ncbi:hypothetical protein [Hydrogenophaga sp. 2FB]|uniref:hypothetical protein n=1 Tax=Hydrogenophaga sp. 2FB TaxID=2502187 RepID=UPI0010F8787C|nr:hypothetical protein [Hydrogenophaga sp. 2FB]
MGQAKLKQRTAFAPALVNEWEAEDGVNFAVALARVTGWLLHVDWWVPSLDPDNNVPLEDCKPLRVYVADNGSRIFDVRGNRSLGDFIHRTIRPIAMRHGMGGVRTRYYAESALATLPLRCAPDPAKINSAAKAIEANTAYLASIPKRLAPCVPAAEAAVYTFGRCAAFAEAMRVLTGLDPVALLAIRFEPGAEGTEHGADGYVHSFVLHPDGMGEDSWGKADVREIAQRFGVVEFRLSREAHGRVVSNLQRNSPELYETAFAKAKELIQTYRQQ